MENFIDYNKRKQIADAIAIRDPEKHIELEARFSDFSTTKIGGVNVRTFDRVKLYYTSKGFPSEENFTRDYNYNPESLRLTDSKDGQSLMRKIKIKGFPIFVNDYGIKISVSTEEHVETSPKVIEEFMTKFKKNPEDISIREKRRY